MFPTVKLSVQTNDVIWFFYVNLDVVPVDKKRYRYIYKKSSWLACGKAEPCPESRLYLHPNSPFTPDENGSLDATAHHDLDDTTARGMFMEPRAFNADADERRKRMNHIRMLREENEQPVPRMSRSCPISCVDAPRRRAVASVCGHALCLACAKTLEDEAIEEHKNIICPFCRKETKFVPLFEDQISEN